MAPTEPTVDYYEYLGVTQSADDTQIKTSYKRLALLYHPDKNPGDTKAKAKFQVLVDAYSILIDPEKRRVYNLSLTRIRAQHATPKSSSAKAENTTWSSSTSTSKEDATIRACQEQLAAINKELQTLYQSLNWARTALNSRQKDLDEVTAALRRLDLEEKKDAAEEAAENGWINYLFGKPATEEKKEARARRVTERMVGRNVHTAKCEKCTKEVDRMKRHVQDLEGNVAEKESRRASVEWRKSQRQNELDAARWAREEKERQKQREAEQRRREEASRKAQEEAWRVYEEARKAREEARKAQEEMLRKAREENERKAREAARKAKEEAEKRRETYQQYTNEFWSDTFQQNANSSWEDDYAYPYSPRGQEREEYGQKPKGKQRKTTKAKTTRFAPASAYTSGKCEHRTWWTKVDGVHTCESCHMKLFRFAYQCPGCDKKACAGCMRKLKG